MRAYGWNEGSTKLVPAEAKILKEAARRVAKGETMRSIVSDLDQRGVLTSTGKAWAAPPLRRALLNPRIVGKRLDRNGKLVASDVPPILTDNQYAKVKEVLESPERAKFRPKGNQEGRLIPSGKVRCERCGRRMYYRTAGSRMIYACIPQLGGCGTSITAEQVDSRVEAGVLARLASWDWRKGIADAINGTPAEIADRIDELEARKITLGEDYASGAITREMMLAGVKKIDAEVTEAARLKLAAEAMDRVPIPDEQKVVRWWSRSAMAQRSQVVDVALDYAKVLPKQGRTGRSDPVQDRVETYWYGDEG